MVRSREPRPAGGNHPGGEVRKEHQQVIVRMPTDMHEAIKQQAKADDLTMAQAIRAAVRQYLAQPAHN